MLHFPHLTTSKSNSCWSNHYSSSQLHFISFSNKVPHSFPKRQRNHLQSPKGFFCSPGYMTNNTRERSISSLVAGRPFSNLYQFIRFVDVDLFFSFPSARPPREQQGEIITFCQTKYVNIKNICCSHKFLSPSFSPNITSWHLKNRFRCYELWSTC